METCPDCLICTYSNGCIVDSQVNVNCVPPPGSCQPGDKKWSCCVFEQNGWYLPPDGGTSFDNGGTCCTNINQSSECCEGKSGAYEWCQGKCCYGTCTIDGCCTSADILCGQHCCDRETEACVENSETCCPKERYCGSGGCCSESQVCAYDASGYSTGLCCDKTSTTGIRCGDKCCPKGETCTDYSKSLCCPEGRQSGTTCCPEGQEALDPAKGTCCPIGKRTGVGSGAECCAEDEIPLPNALDGPTCCNKEDAVPPYYCCGDEEDPCGSICCPEGEECLNHGLGLCCKTEQKCGSICCPDGQECSDSLVGTCCKSCTNCLASGQCNDGYTLKGNTTTSTGLSCGKTCCRSDSVTYDEHNSVKYGSVGAIDGVCCGGAIEEKQGDGFQHSTTTTTYRIENGAQGLKCLRSSSYADYHGTMFINSWTSTENYDGSYTTKECWGSGGTEASECYCSQSGGPSEKC